MWTVHADAIIDVVIDKNVHLILIVHIVLVIGARVHVRNLVLEHVQVVVHHVHRVLLLVRTALRTWRHSSLQGRHFRCSPNWARRTVVVGVDLVIRDLRQILLLLELLVFNVCNQRPYPPGKHDSPHRSRLLDLGAPVRMLGQIALQDLELIGGDAIVAVVEKTLDESLAVGHDFLGLLQRLGLIE